MPGEILGLGARPKARPGAYLSGPGDRTAEIRPGGPDLHQLCGL